MSFSRLRPGIFSVQRFEFPTQRFELSTQGPAVPTGSCTPGVFCFEPPVDDIAVAVGNGSLSWIDGGTKNFPEVFPQRAEPDRLDR